MPFHKMRALAWEEASLSAYKNVAIAKTKLADHPWIDNWHVPRETQGGGEK